MNCTSEANPPATVKWQIPDSNESQVFNTPFTIPSFQASNEGTYLCILDNGIEPKAMRQIHIHGQSNAKPNVSKPKLKHISLLEGDNVTLNCQCDLCEPLTSFMWLHEKPELYTNNSTDIITNNKRVIYPWILKNVLVNESGFYTCLMENKWGTDEFTIEMVVKKRIELTNISRNSLYHKCTINKHVNLIEVGAERKQFTVTSNLFDCISLDAKRADLAIILLGNVFDLYFNLFANIEWKIILIYCDYHHYLI